MSGFPSSIGGLGGHGHGGDRDLWIERLPSPPPTPAPPEASLTTQERLRLAKRRRAAQLKRWTQRDMAKGASAAGAPDIIQGRTRSGHSVETKLDMYQRVSWNISWQKGCPLGARDRTMTSRSAAAATGTVVHPQGAQQVVGRCLPRHESVHGFNAIFFATLPAAAGDLEN